MHVFKTLHLKVKEKRTGPSDSRIWDGHQSLENIKQKKINSVSDLFESEMSIQGQW